MSDPWFNTPKREDGKWSDGWDHRRDETGFCVNCGARRGERHYKLVPLVLADYRPDPHYDNGGSPA